MTEYKAISQTYWDQEYLTHGWPVVHNAGSLEKTESLADREISLFLFPDADKVSQLIDDTESNPYPTFTRDFDAHPSIPEELLNGCALDYGCGALARYTVALADRFRLAFGVDISTEAIRMAQQRLIERQATNNSFLRVCDGTTLDFPDGFFSFIFSNLVLQHIGNKEVLAGLAAEFGRCLAPGGMMRLEYLDSSQHKPDGFASPVEGNGITEEELGIFYGKVGCDVVCITEAHPWLWVTITKPR